MSEKQKKTDEASKAVIRKLASLAVTCLTWQIDGSASKQVDKGGSQHEKKRGKCLVTVLRQLPSQSVCKTVLFPHVGSENNSPTNSAQYHFDCFTDLASTRRKNILPRKSFKHFLRLVTGQELTF